MTTMGSVTFSADATRARDIVARGEADAVAFGRLFSSNPDLPERLRHGWPLTPYDRQAFWGDTDYHHTDYQPTIAPIPHRRR
jgi:N-ethylmaleimide reductase